MFDAEDKRTLVQLVGLWIVGVMAVLCSLIMLAIGAGIAYRAFEMVGGL